MACERNNRCTAAHFICASASTKHSAEDGGVRDTTELVRSSCLFPLSFASLENSGFVLLSRLAFAYGVAKEKLEKLPPILKST